MIFEEITDDFFEKKIIKSKGVVILFLSPSGSGAAYIVKDFLEYLHKRTEGQIKILQMDPGKSELLRKEYYIHDVFKTAILIFNNGKLCEKIEGLIGYAELKTIIRAIPFKSINLG